MNWRQFNNKVSKYGVTAKHSPRKSRITFYDSKKEMVIDIRKDDIVFGNFNNLDARTQKMFLEFIQQPSFRWFQPAQYALVIAKIQESTYNEISYVYWHDENEFGIDKYPNLHRYDLKGRYLFTDEDIKNMKDHLPLSKEMKKAIDDCKIEIEV